MNENAKKAILIVVVIAGVIAAVFGGMRFFAGERQDVIQTLPQDPNFKSEKQLSLEAQSKGEAPPVDLRERDLSGAIGGG